MPRHCLIRLSVNLLKSFLLHEIFVFYHLVSKTILRSLHTAIKRMSDKLNLQENIPVQAF